MKYLFIFLLSLVIPLNFVFANGTEDEWIDEDFNNLTLITDNDNFVVSSGFELCPISTDQSYNGTKSWKMKSDIATACILKENGESGATTNEYPYFTSFEFYIDDIPAVNESLGYQRLMTCQDSTNCTIANTVAFQFEFFNIGGSMHLKISSSTTLNITSMSIAEDITIDTWNNLELEYNNVSNVIQVSLNDVSLGYHPIKVVADYTLRQVWFKGLLSTETGLLYLDDLVYNGVETYEISEDVTIMDLPDYKGDIYVGSEYLQAERFTHCQIGEYCSIDFNYPYSSIGNNIYLILESDRDNIITIGGLENSAMASTTLIEKLFLRASSTPEAVATSSVIEYCLVETVTESRFHTELLYYYDVTVIENVYCGLRVSWSNSSLGELLDFDPYDITKACEDVATSSGSTWDDFRYGVECGLNKTVYWTFHPSDESWYKINDAKNVLLDEFPLNLYQVLWVNIFSAQENATSTNFQLPLYVGELGPGASTTIIAWESSDLGDTFGETWTRIYDFMTVIIYFFTFVYFFNWFVKHKQE